MATPNNINYWTVTVIPGSEIINRAYNASKQVEYLGHAIQGSSGSANVWTIRKYTYTSNQVTSERIAVNVAWDDRATTVVYT